MEILAKMGIDPVLAYMALCHKQKGDYVHVELKDCRFIFMALRVKLSGRQETST